MMLRISATCLLLFLTAACNVTPPVKRTSSEPSAPESAAAKPLPPVVTGSTQPDGGGREARHRPRRDPGAKFDFYVLTLSWSPQYCATPAGERDNRQCAGGRPFDFVLHGMWPQYEKGWPQDCNTETVDRATVDSMLDIMPSPRLVQHEWSKHGTCSGLSAKDYFAESRRAFQAVQIPAKYQRPKLQVMAKPSEMRREFAQANPKFTEDSFAIVCTGRYLQEVRACLTPDFDPRPCNREVLRNQCRVDEMIMRPVRN